MSIEKSIIISALILAFAYVASPVVVEAYKMQQCTDAGRDAETCFIIMHRKR